MRSVIDFLNKLHDEVAHFNNERIKSKPLQAAIDQGKIVSLSSVTQKKSNLSTSKFVFPPPAKPTKPIATEVSIRFIIPKKKYDLVSDYFDTNDSKMIGEMIFNYFFEREIEE